MDSLLDLLFGLLALAGKYWFLVLGYLVYRMLGLDKKKNEKEEKQKRMPPLTPTVNGGQPKRMTVGQKPETAEPQVVLTEPPPPPEDSGEGVADWRPIPQASLTYVEENNADTQRGGFVPSFRDAAPMKTQVPVEPAHVIPKDKVRDGMKWAIILSQPRSKAPYRPFPRYKKSE